MAGSKFETSPADEALFAFDADHNVEPARTIAERIASKYGCGFTHALVDDISHAIEDARDIGRMRAGFELMAQRS